MNMLINTLDNKIKDMRDLRHNEEQRDSRVAQDAVDQRYSVLTDQLDQFVLALQYTKTNMSFQLNNTVLDDLESLLLAHKGAVQTGYADKDIVLQVEKDLKVIENDVKKEWTKKFTNLTGSTIGTLKVLSDIDEDKVSECLQGIERGENWTASIDELQEMNISLLKANELISRLKLDTEIIDFLQKMNNGKATVIDLNDKVIKWLKDEALENKVKLYFR